jgi:hypothetical protein
MPPSSQFCVPETDALPLKESFLFRGPSPCWRDDVKIIIMQTLTAVKATAATSELLQTQNGRLNLIALLPQHNSAADIRNA